MTHQLSKTNGQSNGALSIYQKFADPIVAVDKLGEWLHQSAMLAKNPGQARVLALACMVRGEDPLKLIAENMIVDGKLTRKYQMLLVDLRNAGGDYKWIETGENGKQATIEITWRGETFRYTFSMEMAKRAGYIKSGGGWEKLPGNMLRSKCVRQAMDMYCPEITAGYLTPEDVEDISGGGGQPAPVAAVEAEEVPFETETEVAAEAIETEPEPAADKSQTVSRDQLVELIGKCKQLGLDGPTIKKHICDAAEVDDPEQITVQQFEEMMAKIEAKLAERAGQQKN